MRTFRFSIAGLMTVVLVVSLFLSAFRNPFFNWPGALFFLACGILTLGTVGVVCGGERNRAWWLGFSVFGWGSLVWSHRYVVAPFFYQPFSPIGLVMSSLGLAATPGGFYSAGGITISPRYYFYIRCVLSLNSLVFAMFGGVLARALFGASARAARPVVEAPPMVRSDRPWRRRTPALLLAGVLAYAAVAFLGATKAPGLCAGVTVLLTWGMLALTVVAAVTGRGRSRGAYLGAALFGAGYMFLVRDHSPRDETWPQTASNRFLNSLRPWLPNVVTELPGMSEGSTNANARVFLGLARRIPFSFRDETPLEDVLTYIAAESKGPDGRGLPIYVDPVGLQEAEKTMRSPVIMVMDGVPLRTTLRLILKQIGMNYNVKDGLVTITSASFGVEEEGWYGDGLFYDDPFLVIGQCVLALLAACLGGVLGLLVSDRMG